MSLTIPYTFHDGDLIVAEQFNANFDSLNNRTQWVTPEMFGAKGDGDTDDTAAIQAAVDEAHGKCGVVCFGPNTYKILGTIYVQKDRTTSGEGMMWNPITLKGAGRYISNNSGANGAGATIIYKPNAGVMISVNLASTTGENMLATDLGSGNTSSLGTLSAVYRNFALSDMSFKGVEGNETTALKGHATQASLSNLSFIQVWRGWDFYDDDTDGATNYSDMWCVTDVYANRIGHSLFRQSNADASTFQGVRCEGFQSTAIGGFLLRGGRGAVLTGTLINNLPSTSSYIGWLRGCRQFVIQGSHFEHNLCSSATTGFWTSVSGIMVEGGQGNVIANNEWFNHSTYYGTPVPALTRPCVFLDASTTPESTGGHFIYGNSFRAERSASFDVADTTRGSLTILNKSFDGSLDPVVREDRTYYRDSGVDEYSKFSNILAGILLDSISTKRVEMTRSMADTDYWSEVLRLINNEATSGTVGHGPSLSLWSKNADGVQCAVGRVGSIWENTGSGSEKSGLGLYVRSNSSDTAAATLAGRITGDGTLLMTGGIGVGNAENGIVSVTTPTKRIRVFDSSGAALGYLQVYSGA